MPSISLPPDYASILNDLNRDVLRFQPSDTLQFCANWFNKRLEEERRSRFPPPGAPGVAAPTDGASLADAASASSSSSSAMDYALENSAAPRVAGGVSAAANTFAHSFSFQAPSRNASISGAAAPGSDPAGSSPGSTTSTATPADSSFQLPANYNLGRRTSVSAESLAPSMLTGDVSSGGSGAAGGSAGSAGHKTVIPKSDSQMARIKASIAGNLLFRNLEPEQEKDVLLAMKEVKCGEGEAVIRQGDQGDYFYIVEQGTLDVYVRDTNTGASSRGSVSTLGSDEDVAKATSLPGGGSAGLGEKKVSYGPSSSFGELALLYAQPRAATVLSTSPCILWALDRITFRSILMETNSRKRALFESFLSKVSLFDGLSNAERAKIADALELRSYKEGERVIEQGERGTEFFIVVEGRAEVRKRREGDGAEESVGRLSRGDYFGELALLNNAPRAASIVAMPAQASGPGAEPVSLRVATLSEQAFKRLVGPLAGIMSRHAEEHYGLGAASSVGKASAGGAPGAEVTLPLSGSGAEVDPSGANGGAASYTDQGVDPASKPAPGLGTWVGGLGSSPFATAPSADAAAAAARRTSTFDLPRGAAGDNVEPRS